MISPPCPRFPRSLPSLAFAALALGLTASPSLAVDTTDTRFLHEPALGGGRVVFVYADDLWVAQADGSGPRRLTSHPGAETNPHISPDGKKVAFTANYDGNPDVYIMPIDGGEPTRLTWHPGLDVVCGFRPDGAVLIRSPMASFTNRLEQFYTVSQNGGFPVPLRLPSGHRAAYSPDGQFLAYTPLAERFRQWKNYRGGTASRIWIANLADLAVEPIPQPEGRCNDTYPMWLGSLVYFLSDRDGEFNLYSYDRKTKQVARLTRHDDFPIEAATSGDGKIVYEQAGRIWIYSPDASEPRRLKVGIAADLVETRPRFARGAEFVRAADVSPTGKRAVLEFRGEILTLPAEKGDIRDITQTPGAHERAPAWSPDGKKVAYFSDASGEYQLVVASQDGQGNARSYPVAGAGFYGKTTWSPDGKKVAFVDNARAYAYIDLDSGKLTSIGADAVYGPVDTTAMAWSPDSKWLAYTITNRAFYQTLRLYSLETDKSTAVTDGLAEVGEPTFDASGKYLYFLASTDAGPVKQWFDQTNADLQATYSVFAAVLARATPNPLAKPSDEEGDTPDAKPKADESKDPKDKDKPKPDVKSVVIDLDGLEGRILPLPIPPGSLANLQAGDEGKIYYTRRLGAAPGRAPGAAGTATLTRFDLKDRKEEPLAEKVDDFKISFDKKHCIYKYGPNWGIAELGKFTVGKGELAIASIAVKVDPRAEWRQMLRETWRINRDYFYDKNMHGADWSAMREKYEALLPDVPTRDDLNRVIRGLLSELAVGHSNSGGGEKVYTPKTVPIGLLGADYDHADGRYRIKKIYGGLNWDPALKGPLAAPGVNAQVGEFVLAVDGENLTDTDSIYRLFEDKVGRRVSLKLGPRADGEGARTVIVEPIAEEAALRNRDWVESNLKKVRQRTGGRVAYVYVPNTAALGHAYFKRYFFPQVSADAIIVDERFNGGGQVADYYIDLLRRPAQAHWVMRQGEPIRTPGAMIAGPKVMLIDETAGSGGDMLPWMFRKFQLGTLVGRRTWGGLVGILGFPVLMDGGRVTAPDLAFVTEDGWRVENEGVPPDVEVEQYPAAIAAGQDPQLDKAIEILLDQLAKNPPKPFQVPPTPIRVRKPGVAVGAR